MTIKLAYLSK